VLNRDAGRAGLLPLARLTPPEPVTYDAAQLRALFTDGFSVANLERLAQIRHAARKNKDWATADEIRDHLKRSGVVFEDTPQGVRYRLP